ncbi:MAG TPA: UPF0182 family protein [Acidobacteriaceae bacterium]|nr:UPF0182 family protein [Acidobacteriaceae bacterium]
MDDDPLDERTIEKLRREVDEHFRTHPSPPRRRHRHILLIAWLVLIGVAVFFSVIAGLLQKWLWMSQLHYSGIFWTLFSVRWGMFAVAFVCAFVFLWLNFRSAARTIHLLQQSNQIDQITFVELPSGAKRIDFRINPKILGRLAAAAAAVVALLFAVGLSSQWDTWLRFRYGGSFGLLDPLFKIDVGFYIFRLPFYELVQSGLVYLAILAIAVLMVVYTALGLLRLTPGRPFSVHGNITRHVSLLLGLLVALWGWGFLLDRYDLVYSTLGIIYGAGYTAAHVTLPVLWVMFAASIGLVAVLAMNFLRPRFKLVFIGAMAYAGLYVVGIMVLPQLFQKFVVQPSELSMELPYLKSYIQFTRKAYGLDAIQETSYPALPTITPDVIARNQETIENIRLWDPRPLLQTFQQTQAIRTYYQFYNVDVGRYHLSDGYHQVMLATRELSQQLPAQAQTWVNQYLQFTHGYGAVMSFASQTVGGGFPKYLIQNIPPQSDYGLNITQPSIYYGEAMPGYRIVDTGIKEFDYPKGNQDVYTHYAGDGGIPLDSLWKRLLFAWTQGDPNILFTSYLQPQSRLQIWRSVQQRVSQIAPFLTLDRDPYAVVSDGKLYWIQDAYTTSDKFPYSNLYTGAAEGDLNYIRNSVKVIVDMYNGTVSFYVMDSKDPILAAYRRAFPGVFKDLSQLSPDLKSHLRYPEDLFAIQTNEYKTFHMTDPQVFYNREDLWDSPNEEYDGNVLAMEPYYILMKLPGSTRLEYLLMTPFTPQNRDNMIAWVAARCDFPEYGKIIFYELPKDKLIYGPNQIEAMIDQNTTISQQLTLWDQKGSQVIRGKLVVIPIENSFLYIVPLYLRAEGTNFPQLKRVIAIAGDRVAMDPTLDGAISDLFGTQQPQSTGTAAPSAPGTTQQPSPQLNQARQQFQAAQKALKQGDWETFGKAMQSLSRALEPSGTAKH